PSPLPSVTDLHGRPERLPTCVRLQRLDLDRTRLQVDYGTDENIYNTLINKPKKRNERRKDPQIMLRINQTPH
ncbi:MAG: hypothetical protein OXK82_00865, partial [Deltaproteobacteria bacterium]|nr:hypothetical protein [Deltaproteobacteria bacterium]